MRFLVAAVVVVALASAGCGGGSSPAAASGEASKPAKQILADAVKAAKAATSVHMSGHVTFGPHPSTLDATVERGTGATGSITVDGFKADVVVVGSKSYIRASSAFWAFFGPAAGITDRSSINQEWVEFSTSDYAAYAALGPLTDLANLDAILGILTSNMGALTKEATTYNGQSVVAIYGPSKIRKLFVSATGTPYPVLAAVKGSAPSSVSFDSWGKSVSLTAPSGAIDISTLGG